MMRIKNSLQSLLAVVALGIASPVLASGGAALPLAFKPDPDNQASVQRGARNFMNYCSGCHSMRLLRYSRIAQDLKIPEDLLKTHLMFTSEKPGDQIHSAMPGEPSKVWFGQQPPDLTVETRFRGADWVYNYLMTFYVDPSRPLGTNNLVLPGASMPHVLADLQGLQIKPAEAAHGEGHGEEAGHGSHHGTGLELASAGTLSADEYKKFVADTVNFMSYAAEPGRAHRIAVGSKVILFLLAFTVLAYFLKREYWKDIH